MTSIMLRGANEVWGVVVTYCPDVNVRENVTAMIRECGQVIVVDNGSPPEALVPLRGLAQIRIVKLPENAGIAAALNRGLTIAAEAGVHWVVTFDQDSRPSPGFLEALVATGKRDVDVGVVGARIEETAVQREYRWVRQHPKWPALFQRVTIKDVDLIDVTMVLTSGALTSIACWRALGGFDERLFIDLVDTDYCLRCRARGWKIAVCANAHLRHTLGRRESRRVMGRTFHPTNHPPLRRYYIARNRIVIMRRHGRREMHWVFFELAASVLWLFHVLGFESLKLRKLRAILLGTWDGLCGRSGPCPPGRGRGLQP